MNEPWYKSLTFWAGFLVCSALSAPVGGWGGLAFMAAYPLIKNVVNTVLNYFGSKKALKDQQKQALPNKTHRGEPERDSDAQAQNVGHDKSRRQSVTQGQGGVESKAPAQETSNDHQFNFGPWSEDKIRLLIKYHNEAQTKKANSPESQSYDEPEPKFLKLVSHTTPEPQIPTFNEFTTSALKRIAVSSNSEEQIRNIIEKYNNAIILQNPEAIPLSIKEDVHAKYATKALPEIPRYDIPERAQPAHLYDKAENVTTEQIYNRLTTQPPDDEKKAVAREQADLMKGGLVNVTAAVPRPMIPGAPQGKALNKGR